MTKQNRVLSKLHRTLDAYEINTGTPFPGQKKAAERKRDLVEKEALVKRDPATWGLELEDISDGTWWAGNVSVGTPAQTFEVDFDTGEFPGAEQSVYARSLTRLFRQCRFLGDWKGLRVLREL